MCGLVGMAGHLTLKHRNVFKDLLFFDTLRGRDSTGIFVVKRDRKCELRKLTVPGYEFIEMPFFDGLCSSNDQIWMGHNRYKTMGSVSRMNAHPFEVLDDEGFIELAGAHNGTLNNKYALEKELKRGTFGTDSEALLNLIQDRGCKDAIAEAEGAWSITYWDAPENTINFIRNKERPMFYAFTKDREVIIWASEVWMILAACRRNGVELDEDAEDKGSVYMTTVDTHYVLEIPQELNKPFGDFIREGGVQGKPEPKFQYQKGYRYGDDGYETFWKRLERESRENVEETKKTLLEETKTGPEKKQDIVLGEPPKTDGGMLRGFEGRLISPQDKENAHKSGCIWCDEKEQTQRVAWFDEKSIICGHCLTGSRDHVKDNLLESLKRKTDNVVPFKTLEDQRNEDQVKNIIAQAQEKARKTGGKK